MHIGGMPYFTTVPTPVEGFHDPFVELARTHLAGASDMVDEDAGTAHIAGWKAQTEYCGEYLHHGRKWAVNFFAVDDADALAKLQSIKDSLVIVGRLKGVIDVTDET